MSPLKAFLRDLVRFTQHLVPLIINQHAILITGLLLLGTARIWTSAQYISLGFCPRVFGMKEFNITRYEGKWYEVEKYWFVFEATSSCVSVEYFDKQDGTFAVEIQQYEKLLGRRWSNPGLTKYRSRDGRADFVLDLLITQSPLPFRFRYPYIVLDTDYVSYTIKYYCQQAGPISIQTMWILARNRTFTPETRKIVYKKLRTLGLDTSRLRQSDQGPCPT